jgi:chaperonin GroEL
LFEADQRRAAAVVRQREQHEEDLPVAHTQVLFRSAARKKILRGATQLCDAVRVTLGPKSKSVLIQKSWGSPIVCNDGVTIAKEFDLKGN